jgi:hypothetical protein
LPQESGVKEDGVAFPVVGEDGEDQRGCERFVDPPITDEHWW